MANFLERFFPNVQAETVWMLMVLACVTVGVWFGKKRLGVAIPVAGVIVLIAAVTIPSSLRVHTHAFRATCISNLTLIAKAKLKWAESNQKQPTDTPTDQDLFGPDLEMKLKPTCPSGGTYSIGSVGEKPRCSWEGRGHKLD